MTHVEQVKKQISVNHINFILYVGSNGFPYGAAAIQRQIQISKALVNDHTQVVVINKKGVHTDSIIKQENIKTCGTFENIEYIYTSCTPRYPTNFFLRNFIKISGGIGELFTILLYKIRGNLTCLIVNSISLSQLKYYWFLSRVLNIKLVYDYVEYVSSLEDRSMKTMGNKKTFDNQFFKYADSLIVISHFLAEHVKQLAPDIRYSIIPPIIDFEKFNSNKQKTRHINYFLYCGSTHYSDVVYFIVEAYRKATNGNSTVSLVLVLNGKSDKISKIQRLIKDDESIHILSNLRYEDLIGYYKNAKALLIPLQNNLQDKARFPFKISEYTAAGRLIITSDSGAAAQYFKDGVNGLLAKTGDVDDFSEKIKFVIANESESERIGQKGHALGMKYFNYQSYSSALHNLIK